MLVGLAAAADGIARAEWLWVDMVDIGNLPALVQILTAVIGDADRFQRRDSRTADFVLIQSNALYLMESSRKQIGLERRSWKARLRYVCQVRLSGQLRSHGYGKEMVERTSTGTERQGDQTKADLDRLMD